MTNIIGICGWKSVGKDTAGKFLIDYRGFVKDSFAKSLKDMASVIFNWDRDLLEGITDESRQFREEPDIFWEQKLDWIHHKGSKLSERFTPRFALQYLGTQLFRDNFHDDIWVSSMESRLQNSNNVVITDCRFRNEMNMIKNLGGKIIWVQRGPLPEWYDYAVLANQQNMRPDLDWSLYSDHLDEKHIENEIQSLIDNEHLSYKDACYQQEIRYRKIWFESHLEFKDSYGYNALMIKDIYKVHESEWKWCGWDFDYIIENNGTIDDLYQKLSQIF